MYQPNTDALYHGTITDATQELARLMYEVAKAHDVPYVSACAFYHENEFARGGDENNWGAASAQLRSGEYTDSEKYDPEDKEESTDENSNA